MKADTEAAALHLAIGALEHKLKTEHAGQVPPGHHNLSGLELVATFPSFAAVDRPEGTAEDKPGYDAIPPAPLPLSPMAVMLFLDRMLQKITMKSKEQQELWLEAIRDAARGNTAEAPAEALAALEIVRAELPPGEPILRATSRKRSGEKEVDVTIRRHKKTSVKKAKAPAA